MLLTGVSMLRDLAKPNFESLKAKILGSHWQGKRLMHTSYIKSVCEEFARALPLVRNSSIHGIAADVITSHRQ